jgi:hypothetical protein
VGMHTAARKTAAPEPAPPEGCARGQFRSLRAPSSHRWPPRCSRQRGATAAGDRWLQLRKQRRRRRRPRAWLPERLGAASPPRSGSTDARRAVPAPARGRRAPGEALAGDAPTSRHWPRGSGKSRAAAEAAGCRSSGPAIVPVDAEALQALAEAALRLNGLRPGVCLWLDGLTASWILDPRMVDAPQPGWRRTRGSSRPSGPEHGDEPGSGTASSGEDARALDAGATVVGAGRPGRARARGAAPDWRPWSAPPGATGAAGAPASRCSGLGSRRRRSRSPATWSSRRRSEQM